MLQFLSVVWNVDPHIFGISFLRWYSIMFFISFILGLHIYKRMIEREKKPIKLYDTVLMPVFLGTFIGARLGHCLFYQPDYFLQHPLEIILPFSDGKFVGFEGLASHGAAIGILIALYWYSVKNNVKYLWTLDHIVITVALSGFFIRMGNLMNSEVYGDETTLPWGFIFARVGETLPKHPTQIYEGLAYLLTFTTLYLIYLKKKPPFKDGVIFALFLIMIFGARFFIEYIKEPQVNFEIGMRLNMGQLLSIPLILFGFWLLYKLGKGGLTVSNTAKK